MCWTSYEERRNVEQEEQQREEELRRLEADAERRAEELLTADKNEQEPVRA